MQVIYELKKPITYSAKGDTHEAKFIELKEPTRKDLANFTPIQQAFMKAVKELQGDADKIEEAEAKETEDTITAEAVIYLMSQSDVDMVKVSLFAEQIFKNGSALIDGETLLTSPLMQKMNMDDWNGLVGTYIANFITPSR